MIESNLILIHIQFYQINNRYYARNRHPAAAACFNMQNCAQLLAKLDKISRPQKYINAFMIISTHPLDIYGVSNISAIQGVTFHQCSHSVIHAAIYLSVKTPPKYLPPPSLLPRLNREYDIKLWPVKVTILPSAVPLWLSSQLWI